MFFRKKVREQEPQQESIDRALRPESFQDYVGQADLIKKLTVSIQAANERNDPLDHTLLFGPPGLGKTTIALIIAKEAGVNCKTVAAPAVKKPADLIEILCKIKERDVLFIDEIHRLDNKVEENLYTAMEDYKIGVRLKNGEIINVAVKPFCLIGATTVPGKMQAPLRDRFGIIYTMHLYTEEELITIIRANAEKLKLRVIEDGCLGDLAQRSRGTPRTANRLLRRVRDYAQINNNNIVDSQIVKEAMELEGVDEAGLTPIDYKYLLVLWNVYKGGPVGIQAIAATLGQDRSTIEDYIEPYLVRLELVARTQGGRMLTPKGMEYVETIPQELIEQQ
jgi:Holliday junction DNA helicase RuvB